MTVEAISRARVSGELVTARDGGTARFPFSLEVSTSVGDGTGAVQVNAVFIDDFTIAASGTLDIDLSGTLTDAHGAALVFTAVKEIMFVAADGNTNNIVVGGSPTNAFIGPFGAAAHTVAVKPGGCFKVADFSAAGWTVVAATGDILRLSNSGAGTSVSGTILILGER